MSDIPTPRTDAATHDDWSGGANAVEPKVSQQLERELLTSQANERQLRGALEGISTMPEYDQDDAHRLRNIATKALTLTAPPVEIEPKQYDSHELQRKNAIGY